MAMSFMAPLLNANEHDLHSPTAPVSIPVFIHGPVGLRLAPKIVGFDERVVSVVCAVLFALYSTWKRISASRHPQGHTAAIGSTRRGCAWKCACATVCAHARVRGRSYVLLACLFTCLWSLPVSLRACVCVCLHSSGAAPRGLPAGTLELLTPLLLHPERRRVPRFITMMHLCT